MNFPLCYHRAPLTPLPSPMDFFCLRSSFCRGPSTRTEMGTPRSPISSRSTALLHEQFSDLDMCSWGDVHQDLHFANTSQRCVFWRDVHQDANICDQHLLKTVYRVHQGTKMSIQDLYLSTHLTSSAMRSYSSCL